MTEVSRYGWWWASLLTIGGLQLVMPFVPGGREQLGTELLLFWVVVIAASLCAVTALAATVRAWRDDTADLGFVGGFYMAVSLLPLVHGITTPGVLYGPNEATMTSVQWSITAAVIAAAPMLAPRPIAARLAAHWRPWVVTNIVFQVALSVTLLVSPSLLPLAGMGSTGARIMAATMFVICAVLSRRHARLHRIARKPGTMAVSIAYLLIGASGLVWVADAPMTVGFWLAHAFDIGGVFLGTIIGLLTYRRGELEQHVLRPIVTRDPLDALELGLDPIVRRFMADLATKDEVTHDHVARTSELAMAVAEECGFDEDDLRLVGIGAMLHDVGKLEIDDAVLNKPGKLDDAEFAHMKTHTTIGAALVRESEVLAPIEPLVVQHHERPDGRGYPLGLRADEIHPLAKVISVCDAFDAMTHTRQYREGMGVEKATAILREHAGAQWDATVVDAMLRLVERDEIAMAPTVMADIGRHAGCACGDLVKDLLPPEAEPVTV